MVHDVTFVIKKNINLLIYVSTRLQCSCIQFNTALMSIILQVFCIMQNISRFPQIMHYTVVAK